MNISRPRSGAWRALLPLLLVAWTAAAQAQVNVTLNIKRRLFIAAEPVIATVTIVNNTGRDIMLADTEEGKQWFSFQVIGPEGRQIPPRDANYELQPLPIKAGETVKRSVNLHELYQLGDLGAFRATASIYLASAAKWFTSKPDAFDVTEGRLVFRQTVGIPDRPEKSPANRTFSLLTLEHDKGKMLYVRVTGEEDGFTYGCYNLGRILDGNTPDAKFDSGNNLAILQPTARKEYILTRVGVNGNFVGQSMYTSIKSPPFLRKLPDGALQIVGAVRQEPVAQVSLEDAPKLSDRPPGFPK
ncbi:MAG TPA: hypothetical protein VGO11_20470 [Chthoniobacteraceae bacterium]|jgi:hypothetical protein|nr:hypothetical protein [Chthoniobacteraceae bacterium]